VNKFNLGGCQAIPISQRKIPPPNSSLLAHMKIVASHTYYTVRSGDSFWSIARKYGISMYTLAANNGKSIYSLIYPGESLYIR